MKVFSMQSEKLLSWIFRTIIYCLKIIGLAPVSVHTTSLTRNFGNIVINVFLYSNMGLLYNLVLSILTLIMGAVQMQELIAPRYSNQPLFNKIMNIVQYILIIFTAWFGIIHWAFQQKKAASIMNRLSDVHCLLSAQKEQLPNKRVFIFLAMHITFTIFVWITFVVSTKIYYNSLFGAIAICAPLFVSYSFLVEYSIVLGFIARELESLNVNLLSVKEFPNDSFRSFLPNCDLPVLISPTHNRLANIKLLHSIRTTVYEVAQDVADFFSLPILPIILLFFYMTVYNVYYIIIPGFIPEKSLAPSDGIFIIAWLIIGVYPLILLSSYITKVLKQAELTGHLVHKLLATSRNREIITELEHFSLHLIHEDFSFTAYGFFTLDFKLLQSIFGATATYLVIIIQFVQSAET